MNKKAFTLIELLSIIALIAIIATISFRIVTDRVQKSREKLYNSLISDLEKAGEKYMLEHDDVDKYHVNTLCVTLDTLKENNYIENDKIINPKTKKEMTGYIKIKYNDEKSIYEFNYVDSCTATNVKPAIETILDNEKVKITTSGAGLYETTDSYVYRGENPNNYIKLNGVTWRIVEIDKNTNMVKVINLNDNQQQYPELGIIKELNNDYQAGTTYENIKDIVNINSKWNTGKTDKIDSALSIKSLERQSNDYNTIGLLSLGEYIDASLDKSCYKTNDCSSYLTTSKKYWLLNNTTLDKQWYVDDNVLKNIEVPTNQMLHIYPVLYLKVGTSLTGRGTELDPYIPE